ncbi:uncharacterized protein LOC124915337 [Impatiens glandulifera]|uniref:uncharacterized protein LOC124915337 n=1 Tax=Impatiens glandulifera TaxID=253017 RepID=UPI001FB12A54|nr:uncharacterized protein LOC124915337 [Impatiens glandulifera]
MGRIAMDDNDENRLLSSNEEEEDQEEEALSLSDLPINIQPDSKQPEAEPGLPMIQLPEDDFDFGSATTEPEMCAADDVFFRGRILPLRHSISSDSGLTLLRADSRRTPQLSRSGSMDQYKISQKNTIIRSSSIRSQYSSSCSSSRSSSTKTNNTIPKPHKPKPPPNPFQHYSNRKPVPGNLNRASSCSRSYMGQGQMIKSNNNNNNMWSILRLGLVRTPTMEPLEIKFHGNNNRISTTQIQGKEKEKKFPYFGGCKCSSVETVVVPSSSSCKGTKEKTKRDMSRRHRTYEWLKELSVADDDHDDHEGEKGRGNLGS